jgi:hypothetical protein
MSSLGEAILQQYPNVITENKLPMTRSLLEEKCEVRGMQGLDTMLGMPNMTMYTVGQKKM